MDSQEELQLLLEDAVDSAKTTLLTLEEIVPLLSDWYVAYQPEVARLIIAMREIERDVGAILEAVGRPAPTDETPIKTIVTAEAGHCVICGHTIQPSERYIPTSTGQSVHIVCADQLATSAHARRRQLALVHGVVFTGVVITAGLVVGMTYWLLALTVVGLGFHIVIHRRWWYYVRRAIGTWLLLGTHK
jgi:hypothetical protein